MSFRNTKWNRLHDISNRMYVYVVGPEIGPKKIGIAKNVRSRLSQYKTHNTQNVKLLFSINCPKDKAKRIEKSVHQALKERRVHGEWFNVSVEEAKAAIRDAAAREKHPPISIAIFEVNGKFGNE